MYNFSALRDRAGDLGEIIVDVGFLVVSTYGTACFSLVGLASGVKFDAEYSGRGEELGVGRYVFERYILEGSCAFKGI